MNDESKELPEPKRKGVKSLFDTIRISFHKLTHHKPDIAFSVTRSPPLN